MYKGRPMVYNRRSELEIIKEIITLSKDGARTTEIIYQCNLSYTQCKDYISFLLDKEIIEKKPIKNGNGSSNLFTTTDKGNELLENINKTLFYFR